jgi:hypothetical protein
MMRGRQIVYFVGAGLSKSLEKAGKRIPLMYDFVQVMAEYASRDKVILQTLARLQYADAFDWPCPEAADPGHSVLFGRDDPTPDMLVRFTDAMMRRPSESVEDLLLRALQRAERPVGSDSQALRTSFSANAPDQFRYAINNLFGLHIAWDVNLRPLQTFLRHQFQSHPLDTCTHTFVDFNYDLILDRTAQKVASDVSPAAGLWHPSTGYGFGIGWYVYSGESALCASEAQAQPLVPKPHVNLVILKPHGSLNWIAFHDENHKGFDPNKPLFLALKDPTNGDVDYWHPRSQECVNIVYRGPAGSGEFCAAHGSIFLIPPTPPAKETGPAFLTKVREAEKAAITEADEIFVIGWSMPVTDQDQIGTIRCCIAEREEPLESVTVINRGERPEYFQRIADTFGLTRSALRIFNNGFSDYVQHCCA